MSAAPSPEKTGLRGLYKTVEDAIGPRLPRPLRQAWRRLVGRPPLPTRVDEPARPRPLPPAPKTFDVVCFPVIAWSFRFQRPQQLMRELGRRDHRVFWIDPDSVKDATGGLVHGELAPRVVDVRLAGNAPRDPFRDELHPDDVDTLLQQLETLQREAGLVGVVAVVQLPFWAPLARRAREELGWTIVYDCMDDHAAFSTNDASMLAGEAWLLRESDLVVTTSRRLRERAEASARRSVSVANGCDYDHFANGADGEPAAALADVDGPVIGYVGAISEWFDFDLIRHAVRTHPDWTFVLVGSTWGAPEHADLAEAANVRFLGEQPYETVPALLGRFDVACIPFVLTPLIEATDPVKLYEYMAAGKPVVASRLPELEVHAGRVSLVDGPEAFTEAVARELANDSEERRRARAAFASDNTWKQRADDLLEAVAATFARASICVVTWNNLELTKACLDSVLADRSWPDIEVLVVDNASTDGTPAYLEDLAARDVRVRVQLNDTNRGFAAANNQAIERASGSYVVLLNNDTVVPRGWLGRLLRVLDADPTIGLVGPVTDGVWNEARIDGVTVAPAHVDGFAADWAREHAGRIHPISMLAMYCVAARRSVVDAVGPLDERFGIGMFEDDDYAHRVRRAGYRLACAEEVFVHHAGQASFDKLKQKDALWEENRAKFEEKWGAAWRVPGLGTRARTLAGRDEVERHIPSSTDPAVVFVLDRPEGPTETSARLVSAFESEGHPIVLVGVPAKSVDERELVVDDDGRFNSTLALEAFEMRERAIVVASADRAFDVAFFRSPRLVYVDEPDAHPAARGDLIARAEVVVGVSTEATVRPEEVDRVPGRLRSRR